MNLTDINNAEKLAKLGITGKASVNIINDTIFGEKKSPGRGQAIFSARVDIEQRLKNSRIEVREDAIFGLANLVLQGHIAPEGAFKQMIELHKSEPGLRKAIAFAFTQVRADARAIENRELVEKVTRALEQIAP